jgi:hypothetical protein
MSSFDIYFVSIILNNTYIILNANVGITKFI